ncbi:MAG TPA: hypothetical protein VJR89_37030, partial [Polyangiales bacterium]|nr:hypothetical protein [Polyangiales bacterium]
MLFVLAIVATLSCSLAHAQLGDPKLISASYDYYPYARAAGDSEASFSMFKLNAAIPIELAHDSTLFIPGLRYSMLDVVTRHESGAAERSPDALYTMLLKAALWQRIDDNISILAAISGGLASDLASAPSSKDWVFAVHVIGLWQIMQELTLGGGIGYDRRTGDL